MGKWISARLGVCAAIFITYTIVCIINWIIGFRKSVKSTVMMWDINSKLYLYGIAGLLSVTYYQAGAYQTLMSYILMMIIILAIMAVAADYISDMIKRVAFTIYYVFLFFWYLGIIIDFFVVVNQKFD